MSIHWGGRGAGHVSRWSLATTGAPAISLDFLSGTLDPRITFTRATTATFVGSNGLIQSAAINAPRFDYNPATLAPRGLLIEEARTNALLYSAQLDTVPWENSINGTGVAPTITANAGTSPDGTLTADRLQFSLAGGTATADITRRRQPYITPAGAHTFSIYLRSTDGVSSYNMHVTDAAGATNNITVTGSWQRFTVTATSVGTIIYYSVGLRGGQALVNSNTADILAWAAQVEAGAFATSYIPTTLLAVARNADVAQMTGTNFSSWYNQSEGTFVSDWDSIGYSSNNMILAVSDSGTTNLLQQYLTGSTSPRFLVRTSGVDQAVLDSTSGATTINKMASAYKANDFASTVNGATAATDATGTIPVVDRLGIGSRQASLIWNGHIRQIAYYNTRLLNTQLQTLTQ